MLKLETNQFTAADGSMIYYYTTPRNLTTKGIFIICHGMSEHARRYEDFAEFLYRKGFIVYIPDQRGHGQTGLALETFGYFGNHQGWSMVVNDIHELCKIAKKENPDLPVFLFGHSMGSVVARTCIIDFGDEFAGAIISGTTLGTNSLVRALGRCIAKAEILFSGSQKHPSKLLNNLSFGSYNKKIPDAKTDFDWLTPDAELVEAYINDPLCGFTCSDQFYIDFFKGFDYVNHQKNINKMPKSLPVLFISGKEDPVGNYCIDVIKIAKRFKSGGLSNIKVCIYPGLRHEIINEKDNDQIRETVANFCLKQI